MSAIQPFCLLFDINPHKFSKLELIFLEAELFVCICGELNEVIREQNRDYFNLIKINKHKENAMLEMRFIYSIIHDILSSEEYSLLGIAHYINVPEDVIYELASGCNTTPSFILSRKLIELHRTVRPDLYRGIVNKIKKELFAVNDVNLDNCADEV